MAIWSAWFPDVLPKVAGCPVPVVEHELRRAAQEFFEESRAWQVPAADADVVADTAEVTIVSTNSEHELVRVEMVWHDGKPLDPVTVEELDAQFVDDWRTHTGTPSKFLQLTPGVIQLYPVPTVGITDGITARISVRPSDTSTGIPDEYRVKYRKAMMDGSLAALMLYPGKPWTAPDLASAHSAKFQDAIDRANYDAAQGFGKARIASRPKWC
jgi:hypothetical protein